MSRKQCWIKHARSTLLESTTLFVTNIAGEFAPGSFDVVLAAFTFDNTPTEAKTDALTGLRILLAPPGCLLLVVSSPAIYINEWASFSTRNFSENRHACDGDRVPIIMLDVPDRRPVEDVFCTDAHYRRLFESAGLRVLDVQSPLATGKEATRWVSETRTAAWTIYVLGQQPRIKTTAPWPNNSGLFAKSLLG